MTQENEQYCTWHKMSGMYCRSAARIPHREIRIISYEQLEGQQLPAQQTLPPFHRQPWCVCVVWCVMCVVCVCDVCVCGVVCDV
jgi:hypothetical protein